VALLGNPFGLPGPGLPPFLKRSPLAIGFTFGVTTSC
jgi:hypothetical protein